MGRLRHLAVGVAAGGLLVAAGSINPAVGDVARAQAAPENRVVVVVDTGTEVRKVCVRFSEVTISGEEALRRADVDAVFSPYGGKGQAVCALCGVGCPSGNCFCDPKKYWAYWRAPPGGSYTTSSVGASSTELRDGDVEGWRWGAGERPSVMATVVEVCGGPEPAPRSSGGGATTTTAAPTPTTTTSGPSAGSPSTTVAGVPSPSTTAKPGSSGGTSTTVSGPATTIAIAPTSTPPAVEDMRESHESEEPGAEADKGDRDEVASGPSSGGTGGGGSAAGYVVFVAMLGGLAAVTVRARRRRRTAG